MPPEILLKAYVRHQSEDAFRELVAGTLDQVYSTSLRVVDGSPHLAQEVAVRVYLDLARKGRWLRKDVVLASWLRERTRRVAVTVLHAEDRPVDRAVLKREKKGLPTSAPPAPAGLAIRVCNSVFLHAAHHKGFRLLSLTELWPAWIRRRHLAAAAVCSLAILVWWNNPFHHRNPIIKSQGPLMTPSSFAQLGTDEDGAPLTPGPVAISNAGTNSK